MYSFKVRQSRENSNADFLASAVILSLLLFYYLIIKSELDCIHRTRDSKTFPGGKLSLKYINIRLKPLSLSSYLIIKPLFTVL